MNHELTITLIAVISSLTFSMLAYFLRSSLETGREHINGIIGFVGGIITITIYAIVEKMPLTMINVEQIVPLALATWIFYIMSKRERT
jgi:hypothetical protein